MSTSLPPIHSKSPPPSPSAAAVHASSSSNNNSDAAVASPAVLDDGAAAALAVLRERLPPIQPPTTQPFKRRPAPSSLASSFGTKKTSELKAVHTLASKTVTDFDKDLIKLDLKTQSQARAALDALEQHHWTKLLLDHLHALTALEENVLYREAGGRENLIREEDRLFMMLFVEFEARMQRIRGREIVGIQLKKHLLAIEQEDVRKAIATEEGLAFGQVLHKEIIYRPSQAAEDNIIPPRSLVVSSSPRTHQSTNRHSSVGRSPNRSSGEVRKPAPPPARPINSARTEDRFVTNGRTMWGTQKEIRQLQSIADAAAANLPPTEQHQREQVEGSELGSRLSIERMFFEESHLAVKREAQRIIQTAEDQKEQQTAHERVAVHAVDIVMDRIIAETAGHLPEDSYKEKEREEVAVVTSASPVHQQASQVNGHDDGLLAKPVSAKRQGSVDVVTCTPTDEELQKPSPQQPALRSRSNSLTRLTATPVEKIEQKRLIDASVEAVEKEGTLLTPMEIITIVDEVHQKLYPCHTEEEWKTSGISTLRVASHHYDTAAPEESPPAAGAEEPHPDASPRIEYEPKKNSAPQEVVHDVRSSEAAKPRRPVSAGPAPPSPPRPQ
ncbi:Hypothetical protein, putative, partial [Bodo saltans]